MEGALYVHWAHFSELETGVRGRAHRVPFCVASMVGGVCVGVCVRSSCSGFSGWWITQGAKATCQHCF